MADPITDEMLSAYVDGELPADRHAAVEAHLQRDAGAREKVRQMREVSGLVRDAFTERRNERRNG